MAIEIKIDCNNGGESALISQLLAHLEGVDYQISVTASNRSVVKKDKAVQIKTESIARVSGIESPTISNQPLGSHKRQVFSFFAANPEIFYSLQEASDGSSLSVPQVRSVAVDAINRNELERKTEDGRHSYRITSRGIARLEQVGGKKNTQPSMAA